MTTDLDAIDPDDSDDDSDRSGSGPGARVAPTPEEFAGYDDLPSVAKAGVDGPRMPRFDGDVSALPDRACWALQNLLTRRHISGEQQPQLWTWVSQYRDELRVRLSELDLRLRIVDELEVAFVEQAGYESRWGRRILKRETIHTYDAILALHLAKFMRAARNEHVLITREDVHEMFAGVTNTIDRDLAQFDKRIEHAIDKMVELAFLRAHRDDPDTFTVSPVISAVMTASVITDLQREFEQFIGSGDEGDQIPVAVDIDADDDSDDADDEGDDW